MVQRGKKLRIALVGAGRMGARWAGVIGASKNASLALVIDEDPKRANAVAAHFSAAASKILAGAFALEIDAVCIAVPHRSLYSIAKKSLLAGKHVFAEKPGATTEKEIRELMRIAKQKRKTFMVGFNYRFFDSIIKTRKLLDAGAIGTPYAIALRHGHPGRAGYEKEWRMNKKLAGGGVLMDQGLHVIDLARYFLRDEIMEISGVLSNAVWNTSVEDTAVVFLKTKGKKAAMLSVSIAEPTPVFFCEIRGEKGSIFIPGLGRKYGKGDVMTHTLFSRKTGAVTTKHISCNPDAKRALSLEFDEFLRLCASGKRTNAEDAAQTLSIVETVYAQN